MIRGVGGWNGGFYQNLSFSYMRREKSEDGGGEEMDMRSGVAEKKGKKTFQPVERKRCLTYSAVFPKFQRVQAMIF